MADPVRDISRQNKELDDAGTTQANEGLSLVPAKPHHTSREYLVENKIPVCGDFGGMSASGAPCMYMAGHGTENSAQRTGRCRLHCDDRVDEVTEAKKKFIAEFSNQPNTARNAAQMAGVSFMTICRWRKQDADFDSEVAHILKLATEARAQFIEDAATLRAMDPTNNADTLRIFMLKNLSGGKYRDMYSQEHSGPNGGPIQNVQHNVRWNIDGMPLNFFGALPPRDEPPLPPENSTRVASDDDDAQ